jgi:hypothetical protein
MNDEYNQVDVDNTENHEEGNGSPTDELINEDVAKYQKIAEDQRIRAEKAEAKLKDKAPQSFNPEDIRKQAEEAARAAFEQRDIEELGYDETITEQIKKVAQLQGVSVRKAAQDPYIQHLVQEHQRAEKVANASATTGGTTTYTFNPEQPPEVDVSTPEGQKAIEDWERQLERHHSK